MDILQLQEKHIYNHLQPIFSQHAYEKLPGKNQFRQKSPHGFRNVHLSLNGDTEGYFIHIQLGTRIEKVERVVEQFMEGSEEQANEKQTAVASLSRFYQQQRGKLYLLADESKLQHICHQIADFIQKKGFCFLESLSKLPRIDPLINRRPDLPSPYMYNQIHRCFKGITMASILHRTDFEKLVSTYQNSLYSQGVRPEVSDNFSRLVNYLRYFSFN